MEKIYILLRNKGFTLAEVLITIVVVGMTLALVLPIAMTNVYEKVRKEKIRTIKHKFTLATDSMNANGLMTTYSSTNEFVNNLKKHLKLARICDAEHLTDCWPYKEINMPDGSKYPISNITTGRSFEKFSGDWSSPVMGIVTNDGTPIIFSYKKNCKGFVPTTQYPWSTQDGKPITNATTSCIAGIFEINGKSGKNKLKNDVISFGANGLGGNCFNLEASGTCFSEPIKPAPTNDCGEYSANNVCKTAQPHWKGGVVECEGVDNMVTKEELLEIANSIVVDHKFDSNLAQEHNFYLEPPFSIMSGSINNKNQAHRNFLKMNKYNPKYPDRTFGINNGTITSEHYVLCK